MNGWGYSPHYYNLLNPIRYDVQKVLEVGICGYRDIPNNVVGASLWVWHDFFPNAHIYGIDNDSKFIFQEKRIHTARADAYHYGELVKAMMGMGLYDQSLDFIVDDAVHDPKEQLALLHYRWPYLKIGGVYAMEDVCPYKCPNGDVSAITDCCPPLSRVEVVATHKDERLLLIHKV